MAMDLSTPPSTSPPRSRRQSPNLSIDLSDLPPLITPSPPSNTLLITNLASLDIFAPENLQSIQAALIAQAPLYSFSPLKSFRRIIVTFYSTEDAIAMRKALDGETVLGNRVRVYFGQETRINPEDQHLHLPKADRLFFISPPPSPPMGWEMRDEGPPNKEVHAEDLASALAKLHARPGPEDAMDEDDPAIAKNNGFGQPRVKTARGRSGTGTVVFDPADHGDSPGLPAISVEDTTESPDEDEDMGDKKIFAHTSRPPVELMES
ncbi:hypothetical protein B0A48_06167 [Cryoendolithus antarcticus]|uniref:Calcipressin n=1 Tax=Cryoendolithus antarcticus TaxID=1507870 RepID=A0A1V8TA58_9PEZI|nr:hypothetical protein B0A48_06167 [Cryoendolithus antarcticus]